jgi:cyanophycinase
MKNFSFKIIFATILFIGGFCFRINAQVSASSISQSANLAKGTLFIIGGGDRDDTLMQRMLKEADWKKGDEMVIMTLSSMYDSTYIWSNDQLARLAGGNAVKFDSASVHDAKKLDSLSKAKVIFICGGDQSRFMRLIKNSNVKKIIQQAYFNGALVGGTSAGAAVMSEKMITGNQLLDTAYESTFDRIRSKNLELNEGLGLLDSVIVDMHFVTRSRFNRLFTAILDYPKYQCIGIDEATALIVHGNRATVSGVSQVIVFSKPNEVTHGNNNLIGGNFSVSVYLPGESFTINK